jgi:dTDP-4-amino-4,6-dideoxygalactose transaminase
LLDVKREVSAIEGELLEAIQRVVRSGQYVLGPDCVELERQVADLCDAPHAIGCASGSDALLLALMAVGVKAGDEVIVPSFTFFSTASAASLVGARPVFVDIDPVTFNLCPARVAAAVTPRTRAIIPVHLFGQAADMVEINQVAARHGLYVIEDAAQSIGATYRNRPVGSWGHIGCFSFYPTKNLGGLGDGGMLTTTDEQLAERLRLLRAHGMQPRYYHRLLGVNSRLDSLQAAALLVKLKRLEEWTRARRDNAARYGRLLAQSGLTQHLRLPAAAAGCGHVWNQYTVRVAGRKRDALREFLTKRQVGTEIYYPVPVHRQECFRGLGYGPGSLPTTELAAQEVLSLPVFPTMTVAEQETVVARCREFFVGAERTPALPNLVSNPLGTTLPGSSAQPV